MRSGLPGLALLTLPKLSLKLTGMRDVPGILGANQPVRTILVYAKLS
jgi:hypothetical protein